MKTSSLIILTVFFTSVFWIGYIVINTAGDIQVDGITISAAIVIVLTVLFSVVSWLLFAWVSKNIESRGIMISVIIGFVMIVPFKDVLGPMAAILVGLVAGFAANMIQKKIANPSKNKSMIIAVITIVLTYMVLFTIISVFQGGYSIHVWDTGDM